MAWRVTAGNHAPAGTVVTAITDRESYRIDVVLQQGKSEAYVGSKGSMVVVAAVDRSERASTVLREATSVAEAFDDTVHAVHVLTQSEFVDFGRTKAEKGDSVSMEQVRNLATEIATEAVENADVSAEPVGLVGNPSDRVIAYANDHDARYIVASPRKRSPVGKAVFGSVAQSIMLNTDIPVVTAVDQSD